MDTVALVREFEVACGATLPETPTQPPVEKLKLRLTLELEELYEKAQAMGLEGTFQEMLFKRLQETRCITVDHDRRDDSYELGTNFDGDSGNYNPVALLDACCDQRYVQDGTVLTCGLQDVFYPAFAEVQRSNMSKFPFTWNMATETCASYKEKGVLVSFTTPSSKDGLYVIKRISDGKILKSINYSPANLAQFFNDADSA